MNTADIPKLVYKGQIKSCDKQPGARKPGRKKKVIKMKELTRRQEYELTFLLCNRGGMRSDCDHNRKALVKLKRDIKREPPSQKKDEMKNEYTFAEALIVEKEEKLAVMTDENIANEVGITQKQLKRFDMASTNNWREQR